MDREHVEDHDRLLTFQEAANWLRVSRATMYRLLDSGQLVGYKVGRSWRFYKADLHRLVDTHRSDVASQEPHASG
jgi:excisionase family DNA binding protein